jgi:hypothetical protein
VQPETWSDHEVFLADNILRVCQPLRHRSQFGTTTQRVPLRWYEFYVWRADLNELLEQPKEPELEQRPEQPKPRKAQAKPMVELAQQYLGECFPKGVENPWVSTKVAQNTINKAYEKRHHGIKDFFKYHTVRRALGRDGDGMQALRKMRG